MADEKTHKFNLLHRGPDGELLHAEVVTGVDSRWDKGIVMQLPGLDIRDGDSITITPKRERVLVSPEVEQEEADGERN